MDIDPQLAAVLKVFSTDADTIGSLGNVHSMFGSLNRGSLVVGSLALGCGSGKAGVCINLAKARPLCVARRHLSILGPVAQPCLVTLDHSSERRVGCCVVIELFVMIPD
ncbi:hypothetical protein N7485_010811 [Penicillium canescens]|nr:hypothetical protein N7485_010811 [Penicillium canescens]